MMSERYNDLRRILEAREWTEVEKQWLRQYLESGDTADLSEIMLKELQRNLAAADGVPDERSIENLERIHERIGTTASRSGIRRLWTKVAVAASVIGLLITVLVLRNNNQQAQPTIAQKQKTISPANDVAPGTNKAVLTLADGSVITLDDAQNGNLTQQGGTKVLKFDGRLSYEAAASTSKEVLYNSISTPRGGQYQVRLPDGTQVWLNAASSIRFPTVFTGKQRRVEITGEAYFEVAKNARLPFIVQLPRSEVQVLGTHFNIMAYEDEDLQRTTLLEGSIKFVSDKGSNLMHPGQQSGLAKDGRVTILESVNLDAVMAWKNGFFHFEGADIKTIMRQLSRWYDIDVGYQGSPVKGLFHADIPKNTNLSTALQALVLTGKVHFEINNKKVIVTP